MNIFKNFWNRVSGKTLPADIFDADDLITKWLEIYRGCQSWLTYSYVSLSPRKHERKRRSLNVAKLICAELARLVWSEKPKIETDQSVLDFLEDNNFYNKMSQFSEYGAAGGGFAVKLMSVDGVNLKLDYVPADCIIPVSWDNKTVTEADFINRKTVKGVNYVTVEKHRWKEKGVYSIFFEVYEEDERDLTKVKPSVLGLPEEETIFKTEYALFSYISTSEANNLSMFSPLGVSIFANAIDTLESLDIAFDALSQEIVLGKKRIIVPVSCLRKDISENGKPLQYFDPADEVFQAFNTEDGETLKISDNTVEMRIDQIRLAIQTLLDILCVQIGFSTGALSFDGVSMKTATEVISENSKTFKVKQAYENQIGSGILRLLEAIRAIGKDYGITTTTAEYAIEWNDSIIEDRNSRTKYYNERYIAGTVSLENYLMAVDGYTQEEAEKEAEKMKQVNADPNNLFPIG